MGPFPKERSQNSGSNGGGIHLPQSALDPERLFHLLNELVDVPDRLIAMANHSKKMGKPEALRDITDALEQEVAHV